MKYTDFHYFDKSGYEIPVSYISNFKVVIPSKLGDDAVFYGVSDPEGNIEFLKKSSGSRFDVTGDASTLKGYAVFEDASVPVNVPVTLKDLPVMSSFTDSSNYYVESIEMPALTPEDMAKIGFPSTTFTASLTFDKVSTELVETQSIFVLAASEKEFVKISETKENPGEKYKLLFFIDCRKQENFRFFNLKGDEVVWTNKCEIDFNSEEENGYRVNLGFTATEEGVYEDTMYICLVDRENEENIYPIGTVTLYAEAIGEDERYRTLFANFGIPDPIKYQEVFANTDNLDAKDDKILLNENSKKMFLSYTDIFPYLGTYKALVNAVNVLGYSDVFFKEWYKELGKNNVDKGNIAYDITYGADVTANTINNVSIEERISLKKLNWLSMVYRINKEIADAGTDKMGFPYVKNVYGYNNSDIIVKLISLKAWLEKYIIGLNCHIVDVSGEGVFFERYKFDAYGTFQQVTEWNNEKNMTPSVVADEESELFTDGQGTIKVDLGNTSKNIRLEDVSDQRIIDFCTGYIDEDGVYHDINDDVEEGNKVFVGGTFESFRTFDRYEMKAMSQTKAFIFGKGYLYPETENQTSSADVIVSDNAVYFNPYSLYKGKEKNAAFLNLPQIQLERANIRKRSGNWMNSIIYAIGPADNSSIDGSYVIKDTMGNFVASKDYITLLPPTFDTEATENNTVIRLHPQGVPQDIAVEYVISKKPNITYDQAIHDASGNVISEAELIFPIYNETYGLRYSALNPYNMPMFSIIGYQPSATNINIPYDEEFYLEILDGKMIFRDEENDRYVFLNFTYDNKSKKRYVNVNTVYYSDELHVTDYISTSAGTEETENTEDEVSFRRFIQGHDYSNFLALYENDPETAIRNTFIHSMTVANAGEFSVDVYGMDEHNNIYAANCKNKAYLNIKQPDFRLYSADAIYDQGGYSEGGNYTLSESYIRYPIFGINYLARGIEVIKDKNSLSISYPTYSYGPLAPKSGNYLHMLDISDLYRVDAINKSYSAINMRTSDNDEITKGYELITSRPAWGKYSKVIEESDTTSIMMMLSTVLDTNATSLDYFNELKWSDHTFADSYLVLYNELTGMPVHQTSAYIFNDNVLEKINEGARDYTGKYRIFVNDESDRVYVWAKFIESMKNTMYDYLASFTENEYTVYKDGGNLQTEDNEGSDDTEHSDNIPTNAESDTDTDVAEGTNPSINVLHSLRLISKNIIENTDLYKTVTTTADALSYDDASSLIMDYCDGASYLQFLPENLDISTVETDQDIDWSLKYFATNTTVDFKDLAAYYITKDNIEELCDNGWGFVFDKDDLFGEHGEVTAYTSQLLGTEILLNDASTNPANCFGLYHVFDYDLDSRTTDLSEDIIRDAAVKGAYMATCDIVNAYEHNNGDYLSTPNVVKYDIINTIFKYVSAEIESVMDPEEYAQMLLIPHPDELVGIDKAITNNLKVTFADGELTAEEIENHTNVSDVELYARTLQNMEAAIRNRMADLICKFSTYFNTESGSNIDELNDINRENTRIWMIMLICLYTYLGLMFVMKMLYILNTESMTPDGGDSASLLSRFLLIRSEDMNGSSASVAYSAIRGMIDFFMTPMEDMEEGMLPDNLPLTGYDALTFAYADLDEDYHGGPGNAHSTPYIYQKMFMVMAFKVFEMISPVWITAGELHIEDGGVGALYAVAHPERIADNNDNNEEGQEGQEGPSESVATGKLYYTRLRDIPDELLEYVGEAKIIKPEDRIENLIRKPYIKAYVKPAWLSPVEIFAVDKNTMAGIETSSNVANFGGDDIEESVQNEIATGDSENYLYVRYTSGAISTTFRPGEKIKLVYEVEDKEEYIGQATYEVVGYSILNGYIIIKGAINNMYLNDQSSSLWGIITISQEEFDALGINHNTRSMPITYTDPESGKSYQHVVPIRATRNIPENMESLALEDNGEKYLFYFKVFIFRNGAFMPVDIKKDKGTLTNMYISYAHHAFVDYTSRITSVEERSDGKTILGLEYNKKNRIFADFVDDTFTLSMYDFDTRKAMMGWMDYTEEGTSDIPRIYEAGTPVERIKGNVVVPADKPYVVIVPDAEIAEMKEPFTYKWRVYYTPYSTDESNLLIEVYNPVLYLDFDDPGMYDVELTVFDGYGNASTQTYRGAYRIGEQK